MQNKKWVWRLGAVASLVFCLGSLSEALVSVTSRGSFGVYRDERDRLHTPFYYSLGLDGIYSNGLRSELDLILNNDFSFSGWQVMPATASLTLPNRLRGSTTHWIRAGRQLLYRGFDISLLDGVESRWVWGSKGASEWVVYGGLARNLDLWDSSSVPLVGTIWSQVLGPWNLQIGATARYEGLAERHVVASLGGDLSEWPLQPQWVSRWEIGGDGFTLSQTWNELETFVNSNVSIAFAYAVRNPKRMSTRESDFIYRMLANSSTRILQGSLRWGASENLNWEILARSALFDQEQGYQMESSWNWKAGRDHHWRPVVGTIRGYGGWLWDFGLSYDWTWSDKSGLVSEWAMAYLDKVNKIRGWAYQLREGFRYSWSAQWRTGLWFECERNHRFDFDARAFVNVTWFH